jgi:hypothetical protein
MVTYNLREDKKSLLVLVQGTDREREREREERLGGYRGAVLGSDGYM